MYVVPREGRSYCHGAEVMIEDSAQRGHGRIVLRGDNEPAIRSLQEEQRRSTKLTIVENSEVGQLALASPLIGRRLAGQVLLVRKPVEGLGPRGLQFQQRRGLGGKKWA